MVGRLVEHQKIRLLQHQPAKNQPRRFAAGKRLGRLQRVIAAEEHLAHQAAQFLLRSGRIELPEPLDGGHALGDGFAVVLRKVADGHFVAPAHFAAVDGEAAVGVFDEAGAVADERFQQRGFAGAVAAHESDFFSADDARGKTRNHLQAIVGFFDAANFQRVAAGIPLHFKFDVRPLDIRSGEL